ncbi:DnaJ-domain-containing protein [Cystobasidium minutum MCA 4210]|uniref:DnaJ-domain-containing protein n=1 Tax=Cystobasidium minutum MCA 4210 TaxID=1397322 RepID=UPI0034CF3EAB|eukprot:jgi/Rhomi1/170279/fgenesh1_kg.4_\
MPGSVLNLNDAYDDTPRHDEPMFTASPRRIGYESSRQGTPRNTPLALPYRSATAPPHLQLSNSPANYDDDEYSGSRSRSPLALPAASPPSALDLGPRSPSYTRPSSSRLGLNDDSWDSKTPYEVLGVGEYASDEEIKAAYKKMALKYHPDKCAQDEDSQQEAKARFQRIAEAFALLANPKRRAEYNILRKQDKSPARSSSSYGGKTSSRKPTFKSSFTPEPTEFGSSTKDHAYDDRPDLSTLDPFVMFDRMFPDMAKAFKDFEKPASRPRRSNTQQPDLSPLVGFDKPPPVSDFTGSMQLGQSRKMAETYQKARIDKHGNLHVSQGQRNMRMHKSGGFTFESRTFSASTSEGNIGMLQAMMASMNGLGPSEPAGGSLGFGGSMFGAPALGYPDMGTPLPPPPSSRSRRQSFGALGSTYGSPTPDLTFSPSRTLQRRPSLSFNEPLAIGSGPAEYDDLALAPYETNERFRQWQALLTPYKADWEQYAKPDR